jgi:hypothetical protein
MVEIFDNFLREPSYLDKKLFIMKKIGRSKVAFNADQNVIKAYNTMHVVYIM